MPIFAHSSNWKFSIIAPAFFKDETNSVSAFWAVPAISFAIRVVTSVKKGSPAKSVLISASVYGEPSGLGGSILFAISVIETVIFCFARFVSSFFTIPLTRGFIPLSSAASSNLATMSFISIVIEVGTREVIFFSSFEMGACSAFCKALSLKICDIRGLEMASLSEALAFCFISVIWGGTHAPFREKRSGVISGVHAASSLSGMGAL